MRPYDVLPTIWYRLIGSFIVLMRERLKGRIPQADRKERRQLMTENTAAKDRARIIIPVWGAKYLARLDTACLPAVLSPGNLPHLAEYFDCELVIVTQSSLFDTVRSLQACVRRNGSARCVWWRSTTCSRIRLTTASPLPTPSIGVLPILATPQSTFGACFLIPTSYSRMVRTGPCHPHACG